jgi:hypothetical protein|nr:MAG TPA: minor tail protein [Caudoviricetes sp.]
MNTNEEAIVFKLEADGTELKKTVIDAETLAKKAAESAKEAVKKASDKASDDVSAATEKIHSDIAKNNEKIKSILSDTESSVRSKAASIAGIYKSEGMSQSDAMKKAWAQVDRSSSGTASKVKKHSSDTSKKVKNDVQSVTRTVETSSSKMKSSASGTASSVGSAFSSMAKKVGGAIAAAFAVSKITAFGKECLSLGSDLAEVQNVVDVTFSGLSDSVDKFSKNAAKQFGLSETMAKKYAGTYGSMAEAFGFTQKQALDMSEALTGLTGDVASFYNISQDEAYTKIKSVFSGETETLKDLGVVMTQSALDAYALSKGFGKTTAEMSEAEKVSLRYAFVQEKLANAQGDYARTSDGWANSTRTLALQFDTLKAELGQGLINVFSPIVQWLNIIVERLTAAATKFKEFTAAIMGVSSDTSSGVGSTAASTEALNDSLSTTESNAKSAAKAMRDLMGFDEINRLSDKSDSTSSTPSAGQTPASTTDNFNDKDKTNTLADSLQHIKKLWDDLYGSFKKGLTTRLNAGNTFQALDNIKQKLGRIKDTLKGIFTDSAVVSSAKRMLQQIATYYGSMVGNFLSIGANLGNALVTGIATFLGRKEEFLKKKLASIFQSTGDIFGSLTSIMNDVTDIINYILQLPETAQVVADVIDIIVTPWVTGLDLLLKFVRDSFSGIAEVINTNKENFMQIGEDLMRFFSTITGAVSDFVDHVSQKAEEVYDQYIAPAIQRIWDGINSLVTFLTGIWQQYISPFLDTIAQGVAELIHDHLKPMADTLLEVFGKAVELISILWKQYVEPFIEWWIANVAPIIMPVLREVWALVKLVVKDVIDKIENVLKILSGLLDFLIGVFTGDWGRAWDGIQEIFDGFVGTYKDSSKNLADFLKETFDNMATSIDQIFGRIREAAQGLYLKVKEKFESIQQTMSAVWENIKAIFSDPKAYFQEKFSAAADAVKYAFSGIRQWFSDLWDDVTESLKAPVNSMIDILNYLIGKLNTLSFDIPDWVPELGGRTFGFQIPEIPYLANGGYVKANTPRLAVIGDNRREGEIVAPESKIAEAVARAMQMVLAATQGSSSIGAAKDETPMQVNVWLGNELLAQQLTKLQKKNDYRSGGLA